jgi:hypothetical protein
MRHRGPGHVLWDVISCYRSTLGSDDDERTEQEAFTRSGLAAMLVRQITSHSGSEIL